MAHERYMAMNGRYLWDTERRLKERDFPQASEKL